MSHRIVTASIAALCGIGLAIAGVGWRSEERPLPRPATRVFCNVDALVKLHPAWGQYGQLNGLPSQGLPPGDSVRTGDRASSFAPASTKNECAGFYRSRLQSKLESRAGEELSRIRDGLNEALDLRVRERRRELVARAEAEQADARRGAEQSLAEDLRALDESRQCERVDAAIKLSALKAQLGAPGALGDNVKACIVTHEKSLAGVRAKLAQDEDALRRKTALGLQATHEARLAEINIELEQIRSQESKRIDERMREADAKLRGDIEADMLRGLEKRPAVKAAAVGSGVGAGGRRDIVSQAKLGYVSVAGSVKGSSGGTRARMIAEIKAEVKRIARENGLEVTFSPARGAKDSTRWFGERLPYAVGKAG